MAAASSRKLERQSIDRPRESALDAEHSTELAPVVLWHALGLDQVAAVSHRSKAVTTYMDWCVQRTAIQHQSGESTGVASGIEIGGLIRSTAVSALNSRLGEPTYYLRDTRI